jgi:membrane associated rhomboid family serine protease/Flp pilus assembly protein TadD
MITARAERCSNPLVSSAPSVVDARQQWLYDKTIALAVAAERPLRISHSSAPRVATGVSSDTSSAPQASSASLNPQFSGTIILVSINLAIFLAMALSVGHLLRFSGDQVLRWGANYGPLTMNGQLWRLITAMFVHIGLAHLLINMWCLYELGALTEHIYGRWSMLLLYGLTGIAGGVASLARNPTIVSAGASGAVFGLAGVLITSLTLGKLAAPRRELLVALASLLAFAAYNLTYGFLKGGFDNGAHVGGLISGLLLGIAVSNNARGTRQTWRRQPAIYALSLLLLIAAYVSVKRIRAQVVGIESARLTLAAGDPGQAIHRLNTLPGAARNPQALALLAAAYTQKRQYAEAEKSYRSWLQLAPKDFAAHDGLGLLFAGTGRLDEASQELQKAVALQPAMPEAWLQLGLVQQKLGRHADAAISLKNAAALDPNSVQTQFALGISEMNLRQYPAAIAAFQKAAQLAPNNYEAHIWLANAYQAAGQANQAAAAYMEAARLRRRLPAKSSPALRPQIR